MKVLILGGTGAMGAHVVQLLSERNVETLVTSRNPIKSFGTIRHVQGNAHDDSFLQTLLQHKWDVIVDFMLYKTEVFKTRVDLLLNSTNQYLYLSSSRVYADVNNLIMESSPRLLDASHDEEFLSTDEYSLAKARQEDLLRASGKANWTIIRPYITYSQNRMQLGVLEKEEWLYRALHGRTIVFSEDISEKVTTLSYGHDVARGILAIMGEISAYGEAFNITTAESIRWRDVLTVYLNVLETHLSHRPKVLFQDLADFMAWKPAKYQIKYDRLYDRKFDNSKISKYIDVNQFENVEIGLIKCMEGFLKNPHFKYVDWHAEILKDKATNEREKLRELPGLKQKVNYLRYGYPTGIRSFIKRVRG